MIIGIGGVSNSGKSTLAKKIKELVHGKSVRILCQDDFVKPHYELLEIYGHIDWETPESIDFKYYRSQIVAAAQRADIVIAEGLFAFWDPLTEQLYDKKIFMSISERTFYQRKESDWRWGKEPEWYIRYIWESYLKYGTVNADRQDIIFLSGEKEVPTAKLLQCIEKVKKLPIHTRP